MNKRIVLMTVLIFGLGVILASCAGVQVKPTETNFKAPEISLEGIEVPQYNGYWFYSKKIKPTYGSPGYKGSGAPLTLAVTFNITNPNPYPVLLDGYKFTLAFEEFDIITVNGYDTQWIPAGKTNQLRVTTMVLPFTAFYTLAVTGGYKLKAKGVNAWQAIEKWWTAIPDMSFPIMIHEGAFTFNADGIDKVVPYKVVTAP